MVLPDAGRPTRMTHSGMAQDIIADWLQALEARHLADLRVAEVTRALRALSSAYVERRQAIARGGALDSAGKRAAFALFYAPLHLLATRHIVRALDAHRPPPETVLDLGCGTGAAGAAWAIEAGGRPRVVGIDRHPWAVDESRWTYRQLHLQGHARKGDIARIELPKGHSAIVIAYVLNELPSETRVVLFDGLDEAAARGARVLILEPIARAIAPWWDEAAARVVAGGGRADEWRIETDLPPLLRLLDKAAGLDHRVIKARSLFIGRNR